jgi:hypothetical protein
MRRMLAATERLPSEGACRSIETPIAACGVGAPPHSACVVLSRSLDEVFALIAVNVEPGEVPHKRTGCH